MRTFVGFGFGAIQGGLFLYEAFYSGKFQRLVVAEVQSDTVQALRESGGIYRVNIATPDGITVREVAGVEVFNPLDPKDRPALLTALREADEVATALPSVDFFSRGEPSVARLLAEGLTGRAKPAVIYTGENHNRAAELLEQSVSQWAPVPACIQFLNTVIGKMSGVVSDPAELSSQHLAPIADPLPRAFLVEAFNRILITRINLSGFTRGISVFEEKSDLLPFEEAKLYGHNATHALLGLLARQHGYRFMSDIAHNNELLALGREAFLAESGGAMLHFHGGKDPLFTSEGYRAYADDLLRRMVNPYLRDGVDRVIRDPARKLGWDDRLIGTMRRALAAGLKPSRYARGARAALDLLAQERPGFSTSELLDQCWEKADKIPDVAAQLKEMITHAC